MSSNAVRKEVEAKKESLINMLINSNCIDELCSAAFIIDNKDSDLFVVKLQMKLEEDFRTHTFTDKSYQLQDIKDGVISIINIHSDNYPEDEPEMNSWKEAIINSNINLDEDLYLSRGSV